jgi:CheY-like chemotaxis protein
MKKNINCVMLIDDNQDDAFLHEREINKANLANVIIVKNSGEEALEYLKTEEEPHSDLIFLDINMPGMSGWDFLKKYKQLDKELQSQAIIVMLSSSGDPKNIAKAKTWSFVSDYITKPLTKEALTGIAAKYFS